MRRYAQINTDESDAIDSLTPERELTFQLAFFHIIVRERLQFGSCGWISHMKLTPEILRYRDVIAALSLLIPFEALSYVIGGLNSRRLLASLLHRFLSEEVLALDGYFKPCAFDRISARGSD
jgi:hypothetical protein